MSNRLSHTAPDADFISAGDHVVVLTAAGRSPHSPCVLMDVDGQTALVRLPDGSVTSVHFDNLAHPDSPAAIAAPDASIRPNTTNLLPRDTVLATEECPVCGSTDLGFWCMTEEREDETDIVGCEDCKWEAAAFDVALTPEQVAAVGEDVEDDPEAFWLEGGAVCFHNPNGHIVAIQPDGRSVCEDEQA